MIPAGRRLPGARDIIDSDEYFVIHAPRQTGKTTTLYTLAREINSEGERLAVAFSCEKASVAGDDLELAANELIDSIHAAVRYRDLPPEQMPPSPWPSGTSLGRLGTGLAAWARSCPLPLVLLIDEIDSLSGAALTSVLRQLRDGHNSRRNGEPFPASVALCGMRPIREYKAASGGNPETLGSASPFNIIVDSLSIANFTKDEVTELYSQHTADTGQPFTPDAVNRAYHYTQGQPWMVNALAREITVPYKMAITPPAPITAAHVDQAKEQIIKDRHPHFDSLAARLREPRVQRVLEPLLSGDDVLAVDSTYNDDVAYVRDLGLITESSCSSGIQVANPMYREVVVRLLTAGIQQSIRAEPRAFLLPDGRLDMDKLLEEFTCFWDAHGEILAAREGYHETAAQLIFMAWLQRIVNGGGYVDREFGAGKGWIDILVRKPITGPDGRPAMQKEVIELKVRRAKDSDPLGEGLDQLDHYLSRHHLDHGHLVIFDRRPEETRDAGPARISTTTTPHGRKAILLRA